MRSVREVLDKRVPGVAELDAMCTSSCKVSRLCAMAGRPCDAGAVATPSGCDGAGAVRLPFQPFAAQLELQPGDLAVWEEDPDRRPYLWDL